MALVWAGGPDSPSPDSALPGGNYGALEPLPVRGGFSEIRLLVERRDLARAKELYEAFFAGDDADSDGDDSDTT